MAKVKKVRCSAKTKEGKRCKNTASGKSRVTLYIPHHQIHSRKPISRLVGRRVLLLINELERLKC
jgi:hypothetical protein